MEREYKISGRKKGRGDNDGERSGMERNLEGQERKRRGTKNEKGEDIKMKISVKVNKILNLCLKLFVKHCKSKNHM